MSASEVSVVIPVLDGERYLGAAIDSVLSQTAPPAEIIVADDGSTDGTRALVAAYGDAVRYDFAPHAGGAQALNRGIALARGALIAFLDADDLWRPDKLALQLAALERAPEVELVFGLMVQFVSPELSDADQGRLAVSPEPLPGRSMSALLARRGAFERVGALATDLRTGWFIDWSMRAADLGVRDLMLPEIVVDRRIHGQNLGLRDPSGRADYLAVVRRNLLRRRQAQ